MSSAVARKHMIEFCEPCPDARAEQQALLVRSQVIGQLIVHGAPKLADLGIAVDGLDHLLSAKRDENAEHDDPNLAGELAPAVKWLGQMKVHLAGPQQLRERNR